MTGIILMIGTTELILIAAVALLLFGGKKLPELMRGMGQGVKNFKEGLNSPVEKKEEASAENNTGEKRASEESSTTPNDDK